MVPKHPCEVVDALQESTREDVQYRQAAPKDFHVAFARTDDRMAYTRASGREFFTLSIIPSVASHASSPHLLIHRSTPRGSRGRLSERKPYPEVLAISKET